MTVLGKTILQGSVATRLRCDGIISNHLTTNFVQNPSVKKFRKSVKIRQSYHKKFDAPFFEAQCLYAPDVQKHYILKIGQHMESVKKLLQNAWTNLRDFWYI